MRTTLLFTNSKRTESDLARLLGSEIKVLSRSVTPALLVDLPRLVAHDLKSADVIVADLPSLGTLTTKLIEDLSPLAGAIPVVARLTQEQVASIALPDTWHISLDTDPPQRLRQTVSLLLAHRDLQYRAEKLEQLAAQQQQLGAATREPVQPEKTRLSINIGQHREALKMLSRLYSQTRDIQTFAEQFLALMRELLGMSKAALYLRPAHPPRAAERQFLVGIASIGIPSDAVRTMTLSLTDGIGGHVATHGTVLRRGQLNELSPAAFDPTIAKEFDALGTDTALPIQDSGSTLGVLTFSGSKITGEAFAAEELEFAFAICSTVAAVVKHISLGEQMAAQQRFTQDILNHVPNGVVVLDEQGRIVMSNSRVSELLNLQSPIVTGGDIGLLPPAVSDLLFETLRTGAPFNHREARLLQSDRILAVSTTQFHAPAWDGTGAGRRFTIGVLEDVTEIKRQETKARESADSEFLQQLASRLSHELRNAMVSVRTFAELLPEKYHDANFRNEFSQTMRNEVERMDKLLSSVSILAQPPELNLQAVTVAEVLEAAVTQVCSEVWRAAGLQGDFSLAKPSSLVTTSGQTITIHRHFTHTTPAINADRKGIEIALTHIVRNAIQSMQDKGGKLTLFIADIANSESSPSGVKISITDTGTGIPVSDLATVFEPFYAKRNVGVGLGLCVAQKIISAHRGRIEVSSKLGKGTSVSVLLPVNREAALPANRRLPTTDEEAPKRFAPISPLATKGSQQTPKE